MQSLYLEYNVSSAPVLRNLCAEHIQMKDGWVYVPGGAGLGVSVNEDIVRKHRVQ
jgi:L-alanine-DL-glutamate epimerase-like enolase superfamily enzyme